MKCNNCGYEEASSFNFCPKCGALAPKEEAPASEAAPAPTATSSPFVTPKPVNAAAQKALTAVKSPLFLALCILVSASTALGMITGGFNVLGILATIFLWLSYAAAVKNECSVSNLRCLSGVTFANFVIQQVVYAIFIFVGAIGAFAFAIAGASSEMYDKIIEAVEFDAATAEIIAAMQAAGIGFSFFFILFFAIFAIVGIVGTVINIFSWKKIHNFTKSLYKGVENGELELKSTGAATAWLMVFGVLNAISAVFSIGGQDIILTFLATGSTAAALIIASILIKKNFK